MCEKVRLVSLLGLFSLLVPFLGIIRGVCFSFLRCWQWRVRVKGDGRGLPQAYSGYEKFGFLQRQAQGGGQRDLEKLAETHVGLTEPWFAVPLLKYWVLLCWGIQAKRESWVTDLLGEPQVRSSSDMRQQWTSETEQSISLRQRQAGWGDVNFPLEASPVQRQLRILTGEQVPGLCATSTAASGTFGERQEKGHKQAGAGRRNCGQQREKQFPTKK